MLEETFCEKCEAYNKHVSQPANLPLRDTLYSGLICPNCAREKDEARKKKKRGRRKRGK